MRMDPSGNPYLELTDEFNEGALRAIICSGQAVVLHKLAIMSKDGDWILREDPDALGHVLGVLAKRHASYRYGAPLDVRWMAGGWSAHLEHQRGFRVRTDFFTRPPRLDADALARIWREQQDRRPPFIDAPDLARMKQTNREKDYVVIGELARLMDDPADKLRYGRSARDLLALAEAHPVLCRTLAAERPLLAELDRGEEHAARLLDEERRELVRRNERRLQARLDTSREWIARWPEVARRTAGMPLVEAHAAIVDAALGVLPFAIQEPAP